MKYEDGRTVQVGDRVRLWEDCHGVVVCSFDTGDYSDDYPESEWDHLEEGVLVDSECVGLLHCRPDNGPTLELLPDETPEEDVPEEDDDA